MGRIKRLSLRAMWFQYQLIVSGDLKMLGTNMVFLFAILGGDDTGGVEWAPQVFEAAEEHGWFCSRIRSLGYLKSRFRKDQDVQAYEP
ncbi:MAG: hypothetical protein Ct9H300mP28_20160 [Pseudomonadota bacterium]|nr:MAG: hypothetical protein Ct9H300mP28_20160 [Pseudomonadota bacterium]